MDAAGSFAGPGKRQRRGPPGLTLLARSREMGELKAGGLVFAAWVERHNTLAPEVVYCCSTQLGAVAKASVQAVLRQLASEHLLDSHCRGLTLSHISVVELSRYELAGGGAKPPPEELPPEAPADPRRSFKYRLKRLVDAAEQCSDGPFVAYVLSTGHKTAVKQLAGGDLARAVYCSELWAAVFEVEMGIAPTPWQDDAVRADLPPGTLGWYAAFMAFGQGAYLLHPTAGSWLLPDAMADAAAGADSGALVWRIKDAPVHVQVEERPLQPARVTCDCSSFRAVGAAVGRCLHTVYISSLEPPPPGPPPPVLIPAARCPRVDDVSVQPGDYIWLPDRTFVACVARSGQLRCCHSGCRGACQHVLEVQAAFGPHLPTPAASHSRSQQSGQQTGSEAASAGLAAAAAGGGGAAGAASASIRDGARRAVVVEEEEEPAGDALPLPPAVRYPYPCDATTAVTMAGWEKAVLLSSPGLGNGGGAGGAGGGSGSGAGGGSGSGGSSGQQGCALSSGALLDLVPLLPAGGGQCACGSTHAPRRVCPAIVYGPQHLGPIDAQLHELRSGCGKASCVLAYDGVHDGLFRYSSRSFFSLAP